MLFPSDTGADSITELCYPQYTYRSGMAEGGIPETPISSKNPTLENFWNTPPFYNPAGGAGSELDLTRIKSLI